MRIDGLTDGKPAAKAGLQVGDVVVGIGSNEVTDMMSYMKALGAFNKGDTAPVRMGITEAGKVQGRCGYKGAWGLGWPSLGHSCGDEVACWQRLVAP
ncbi:MAG: PDZ domain-containing protein, partial [Flavobacteriales bacterium]